jgi:hypothetical protein
MNAPLADLAPVFAGCGVILAVLAAAATRQLATALTVLLDLLLVTGLLRLSASASWQAIAGAAAVIALRKLASWGIARSRAARSRPAASQAWSGHAAGSHG